MDEAKLIKGLAALNALSVDLKKAALTKCCGASLWVETMLREAPFRDIRVLDDAAQKSFAQLGDADWLEAFLHHPKIGDIDSFRAKFASAKNWSAGEQASAGGASEETLKALAEWNGKYEAKFGFIFIVFASGKSAEEMLSIIKERFENSREAELNSAALEQTKITTLRITKLLSELSDA